MSDPGIIRNRLKINAAIENAKTLLNIQKESGSFKKWLIITTQKRRMNGSNFLKPLSVYRW
jgi:DNA-3-methyladenine glycosylase I